MDDNVFLLKKGRHCVLKKFKVRRGCTVPCPLTWPTTKKYDDTEEFVITDSVDGCSICRRPSLSGPACAWTPHGLYL